MSHSIIEQVDSMIIKGLLGDAPKCMYKWAEGEDYKKSPDSTLMAAYNCIIRGNLDRLKSVVKVACHYGLQNKIRKFAEKFQNQKKVIYEYDKSIPPQDREKMASSIESSNPIWDVYKNKNSYVKKENTPVKIAEMGLERSLEDRPMFFALAKASVMADNDQMIKISHIIEKVTKENPLLFLMEKQAGKLPETPVAANKDKFEKVLGKELAEKLFSNGSLNMKLYNTLPKSDKDLLKTYHIEA